MKPEEIRELSDKEREEKLLDLKEEYFNLKFQLATGKIENPGRLRHMRRDMAKIITLQNEKARLEAKDGAEDASSADTKDETQSASESK